MEKTFKTIDNIDVENKVVLVRVDINSPVDESGKVIDNERIREHSKTIRELSNRGAKVVILAHQGRKGDKDFISLEQHAILLSKYIGKEVKFVNDIIGEKAIENIKNLKKGEILLLDNVRYLDEETEEKTAEEHAKSKLVQTLAPLANIFVQDAFSASHRAHASIVGFSKVLPTFAGRVMENEIKACEKISNPERPLVYILGGAKIDDCIAIMKHMLEKGSLDFVLTTGLLAPLLLLAKGYDIGNATKEVLEKKKLIELVEDAKQLLEKYGKKIKLPLDVALEEDGKRVEIDVEKLPAKSAILDIGKKTIRSYKYYIKKAKTILVKGPAGVYEKKGFEKGTKAILKAIANLNAFKLIGGGDTGVAIEKLKIDASKFSYISIAGGALITYLSGKPMPGIEVL
ncbi:MAG: phosphoglycerate kinase [Candidatus Aenigmarchaeota archaeon]|nr:phosphoglycerate kinase [Candidatus Aenigmarchaeota archaeon]MDW8149788.1 phosphoglycerate kinase [Candidatus Aenigmarchaeota archaeon]